MRKNFMYLAFLMLMIPFARAQQKVGYLENFDSTTVTLTSIPATAWQTNTNYYVSGSNSYRGKVPNLIGDSIVLETPVYDFTTFDYVTMRFNHICKVSPSDTARIEYRVKMGTFMGNWLSIPLYAYRGAANSYLPASNFDAASYTAWQANNNIAYPTSSWWREEIFDLSEDISFTEVQFRFIIKRGNVTGTQVAYGWLIDDFEIVASNNPAESPAVQLLPFYPQDTVYSVGTYSINAKVATRTISPIENPYLKYTATRNGVLVESDSILMTNVAGDSIWTATLKQFVFGTNVSYSIQGMDGFGNHSTVNSSYYIKKPEGGETISEVIIGTGTTAGYYFPYTYTWDRGWTRSVYFAYEIEPQSRGGVIKSVYYYNTASGSSDVDSLSMYFKATNDSIIVNPVYVDPISDGAVLVWGEATSSISGAGWKKFELLQPFYLPSGMNLLIYWNNKDGSYDQSAIATWRYTTGPANVSITSFADEEDFPTTSNLGRSSIRANVKIEMQAIPDVNHTAAMYSIDIPEPVMTAPGHQAPIDVTIQNKGTMNLSSAVISYSINGATPISYNWTATTPLPWDHIAKATIGTYTPKMNGYDTLKIWISMPNGVTDSMPFDDTLKKIIFGTNELRANFVIFPEDTVYFPGPHEVGVSITSLSNSSLPSVVKLNVMTDRLGFIERDTLTMVYDASDNLWKVEVPMCRTGSNVSCSIDLSDALGNEFSIEKSYYISKLTELMITGNFYFSPQDSATTGYTSSGGGVFNSTLANSWSKHLYLANNLFGIDPSKATPINSIEFRASSTHLPAKTDVRIYLKATTAISHPTNAYVNPVTDGATLVYQGPFETNNTSAIRWSGVVFQKQFILPPNHNLLVYVVDSSGFVSSSVSWLLANQASAGLNAYLSAATTTATSALRVTRFGTGPVLYEDSVSVALNAFTSPKQSEIQFTSPMDIEIEIMNVGHEVLDSCEIGWTLDGVPQKTFTYIGPLYETHKDIVKLGELTVSQGGVNAITAWVAKPNGQLDPTTYDDTLTFLISGCAGPLTGTHQVGTNAPFFKTIKTALESAELCGVSGKVIFELESQTYNENVIFSSLLGSAMSNNDTIILRPQSGSADDVIIKSASGTAIQIANISNIIIENITIDARQGRGHGIELMGEASNIVIQNCEIFALPSSATTACCIYKRGEKVDKVFIRDNLIDGGNSGIYMYGASSTVFVTNILVEGNLIQNHYQYGIYGYYCDFSGISYNTILSSESTVAAESATSWYGIYAYYTNAPIIGNKIHMRGTRIATPYGIYTSYFHYYPSRSYGLIANNEIITRTEATTPAPIYLTTSTRADCLHNSVYVKGSGATRGILITSSNTSLLRVESNNIIMESPTAYPIYLSSLEYSPLLDIKNNNMYGANYVGFLAVNIPTISMWQQVVPNDKYSKKILPSFVDLDQNLDLASSNGLIRERDPLVSTTINREARTRRTVMGAYGQGLPDGYDLALTSFIEPTYSSCSPDYVSVKIEITNNGSVNHDFITNPLVLHLNAVHTLGLVPSFDTSIIINRGTIDLFGVDTCLITGLLDVSMVGEYQLTAWVTNALDNMKFNDTIRYTYNTVKVILPVDEDFSNGVSEEFIITGNTPSQWNLVTQGIGADSVVKPISGTSMLMFNADRGDYTELTTLKLDLQNVASPRLELWYFHDTIEGEDYLDVNITTDGGASFVTALPLLKQDAEYGWKRYEVDLTPYRSGSCVNIVFESMSLSGTNVSQYIDRIRISAPQDIAIVDIYTSELTACDLKQKAWYVVLENKSSQRITYSETPTAIELELVGTSHIFTHPLNTGYFNGFSFDTITIVSDFDFTAGTYNAKARYTTSLDEYPANDVYEKSFILNPSIYVRIENLSNCVNVLVFKESEIAQTVVVTNTGNMDLSGINLIFEAKSTSLDFSTTGYISDVLHPGESFSYTFVDKFIAPKDAEYQLDVIAYLACDSILVNADTSTTECVDIDDIAIISLVNPPKGVKNEPGQSINIEVDLKSYSEMTQWTDVEITAVISSVTQGIIHSFTLPGNFDIHPLEEKSYIFSDSYIVPNEEQYSIMVYIESKDNYRNNDTLIEIRETTGTGIESINSSSIYLGQNIPNPAKDNTIIRYNVPQDGEVSFQIYSVSGQLLYNKSENVQSGDNQIEICTANFAAGIYFYTMEFEGQRITKRMSKQ